MYTGTGILNRSVLRVHDQWKLPLMETFDENKFYEHYMQESNGLYC